MTEDSKELRVEVERPAVRMGSVVLNVTKVWGTLELRHRGNVFSGGMTWVPDGQLPVAFGDEYVGELSAEECAELFGDLLQTLMPSVKVFVHGIDESEADF